MPNTRENTTREMTFEEEAKLYEKEARAEFAKETGGGDCSVVNSILRRGMRIISKARQEIANGVEIRECIADCKNCWKTKLVNAPRRWIPVTERLPEKTGLVLGYDIGLGVLLLYYEVDAIRSNWQSVTHWMPLPEPPEVEK